MILPPDFEWHLDCKPRAVQVEALARSFYGMQYHTDEAEPLRAPIKLRDGPKRGWGHMLEMRLGKTPTMLNEAVLLKHHHGLNRSLFLSPNTYKPEWVREAQNFGVDLPFEEVQSSGFKKEIARLLKQKEWCLVVNYEALRSSAVWEFLQGELQGDDTGIFADESIKLKNPNSITCKRATQLKGEAHWRRVLTGKPITQGPQDMFAQLRFLGETEGQNFFTFRNRYCKMGGFKNKKVVGAKNEEELSRRINDTCFVAKRVYWGKVVEPDYVVDNVEMLPAQIEHYMNLEHEFFTMAEETEQVVSAEQVITKLMKQQQISSGFVYADDGSVIRIVEPGKVPKMSRVLAQMEETSDKVLVLYHYNQSGDDLSEALAEYNPAFIRSKGWMKANGHDVLEEKDKFNNDPSCRVCIASIEAVKYGNTLVGNEGDRCTVKIFYENTYSLDSRSQVEMRNIAAFQDWSDLCIDFASCPVERNVAKALAHKESIVTAVLGTYRPDIHGPTSG